MFADFRKYFAADNSPLDMPSPDQNPYSRDPRLFAIVSWGASATHWLTRVVNAHPSILCVHHQRWAIGQFSEIQLDAVSYMRMLRFNAAGYELVGDCHGISLDEIPSLTERWPDVFCAATVVRHPVSRLRSAYALWEKANFEGYDTSNARKLHPHLKEPAQLIFADFVHLTNRVIQEADLPLFTMERLTTEPQELNRLLSILSGGLLSFDSFEHIEFRRRTVSHAESEFLPKQVFANMPGWQTTLIREILSHPAREVYESLGYDLSFL